MSGSDDKIVAKGHWGEVRYASRPDRSCPAKEFYDCLSTGDQSKLNNLFKNMADAGRIYNREKFKQVEGAIFEFKCFRIRISCYRDSNYWYLLHGFSKKGNDWPEGELIRAKNLLNEHRGYLTEQHK